MNKKLLAILAAPVVVISAALAAGITPKYLANAPEVATGIGARLACSMHYVMEQDPEQIAKDIKVYSPMLAYLDYEYDPENKSVSARIAGVERSASWLPKIGCALDYEGIERPETAWVRDFTVKAAAPWPHGYEVSTINPAMQTKLDSMLIEDNKLGMDTRALLVVHQGKIVAESYAEGYDERSLFLGWSMSKSITALLAGWMVQQGKMNVLEMALFPEWMNDERRTISIMNLLQMTDGLAYDEVYSPGETAPAMLFQSPDVTDYMLSLPLRHTPGEHYNYSSGSTNLVMKLIQQRLARDPYEAIQIIDSKFFKPLGLDSFIYETDSHGTLMGSAYMYANARDWAKIGQLMLNGGHLNNYYVVTPEWVRESLQVNASINQQNFGYNWWLNQPQTRWKDLAPTAYTAKGNREQRVMVLPDHELVIVRLGWSPDDYRDNDNAVEIISWLAESEKD